MQSSTVSVPHVGHAGGLVISELLVARAGTNVSTISSETEKRHLLIRVVHVVVDGVNTGLVRARVAASGAAGRGTSLSRGVVDLVAGARAATLESVVET